MSTKAFVQFQKDFSAGKLLTASRKELEHYAMMVCNPGITDYFAGAQWPQVADTVRLLLLVRISEESQNEGLNVARGALKVSQLALYLVLVQVALSLPPLIEIIRTWLPA